MNALRYLLLPFSLVFRFFAGLRNTFYNTGRFKTIAVSGPVISVGNLSTGGTGKTPMVEYIIRLLLAKGLKPASLSRGYGRKTRGFRLVKPDKGSAADFGDEPLQIALEFPEVPVAVCENRVEGALILRAEHDAGVIVLDDAFQHRQIARDLDIVLLDANRPPHLDFLLPAGHLREPVSSLSRAHIVIFTKVKNVDQMSELKAKYLKFRPGFTTLQPLGLFSFADGSRVETASLKGKKVIAFAGIGNPEFFEYQLRETGADLLEMKALPDHHTFTESELEDILRPRKEKIESGEILVLTTAKDHARLLGLESLAKFPLSSFFYLKTGVRWLEGEDRFEAHLNEILMKYA